MMGLVQPHLPTRRLPVGVVAWLPQPLAMLPVVPTTAQSEAQTQLQAASQGTPLGASRRMKTRRHGVWSCLCSGSRNGHCWRGWTSAVRGHGQVASCAAWYRCWCPCRRFTVNPAPHQAAPATTRPSLVWIPSHARLRWAGRRRLADDHAHRGHIGHLWRHHGALVSFGVWTRSTRCGAMGSCAT